MSIISKIKEEKLDVLGAHLSGALLKSGGCLMWDSNPHSSERNSSQLWVARLEVGFMVKLCPCFSYLLPCGPSLIHLSVDISQPVSRFPPEGGTGNCPQNPSPFLLWWQ